MEIRATDPRRIAAVLLLGLTLAGAAAVAERWTPLGPDGGASRALAADPRDPDVVYAGTDGGGVFKSFDGGRSWRPSSRGLTNTFIFSLAVDPADPDTLYAGAWNAMVFKSADGGASWRPSRRGLPESQGAVRTLVIDPSDPDTLYAAVERTGVFKSTDGGAGWTRASQGLGGVGVMTLALDPRAPRTLYVGTRENGVFKSTDGGASWASANRGIGRSFILDVVVDPASGALYAAGYRGDRTGVLKSTDGGAGWRVVGANGRAVTALALDPRRPQTVYAATFPHVLRSEDGGRRWRPASNGLRDDVAELAWDGSVLFAGTGHFNVSNITGSGLYRSENGSRWVPSSHGLHSHYAERIALVPGRIYVGTSGDGVHWSTDGGRRWSKGLDRRSVYGLTADPGDPLHVLAATNDGLFQSRDGGRTWVERALRHPELGRINALSLAFDRPGGLLWAGSWDWLHRSSDGGVTWQPVAAVPGLAIDTLVVDPSKPGTVYAGCRPSIGEPGPERVFKTTDGGQTWLPLFSPRTGIVYDLAAEPNRGAVYAAAYDGIYRSFDGGVSWARVTPRDKVGWRAVANDPVSPGAVYAATSRGFGSAPEVYRSTNHGETWETVGEGLPDILPLTALEVDDAGNVYAGTNGGGLFKLD